MVLLAIDTSEQSCSVALLDGDTVIDECSEHLGRGHAERLLPMIAERLALAGLTYADLNRIAVTTGPGTFTGLRIGLSVARGLALQADIPCIGLTGLQVLAAQALAQGSEDETIHAMITGRGGQAFLQSFAGQDEHGLPVPMGDPQGLDADVIASIINATPGTLVGSGVSLLREKGLLSAKSGTTQLAGDVISAPTLGRLAASLSADKFPPEPTYFRAADAKKATPALPVAQADQV